MSVVLLLDNGPVCCCQGVAQLDLIALKRESADPFRSLSAAGAMLIILALIE